MQSSIELTSDCCVQYKYPDNDHGQFTIIINEKYSINYGYHVWPSAPILAQFISYYRSKFNGKRIIELGSGTGMVGIVAAKIGALVVLTDSHQYPQCLQLCQQNVDINGVNDNITAILPLTWGHFDEQVIQMPSFDYIISSDCFYNEKDFEDILSSVSFLMDKHQTKGTVFYTTYQERDSEWSIECLLNQWHLKCHYISLSDFETDNECVAKDNLSSKSTIHLLEITKNI
ncbi:histone-arginine methyltransferase METTL23-like [Oppia nitens]|uniref:histone-arginine methyltransferase METTL23-like n=1 Tax=Oppia nitens TaxID=1686743 RepID=UPI0023D9C513|nr:histone-arginine methyltransferase METTL23-like [Oppia nitens]